MIWKVSDSTFKAAHQIADFLLLAKNYILN